MGDHHRYFRRDVGSRCLYSFDRRDFDLHHLRCRRIRRFHKQQRGRRRRFSGRQRNLYRAVEGRNQQRRSEILRRDERRRSGGLVRDLRRLVDQAGGEGAVRLRLQSWRRGVPAQRRREEYLSRKRRQLYAPAGRFCDLPQQRLPSKFAYRRGDRCERRRVHDDRGQHQRRRRRVVLYQYRQRKHALSVLVDYAGLYLNRFSGRVDPNERRQLYGWRRNAV